MYVRWFILVLFITDATPACVKNKIKLWSPTKCEAGRSFFARLSTILVNEDISQPYLFPWLTEIRITLPGQVTFCTGALINDRYVLTAQSCFLPPVQENHVTLQVGFYNGYNHDVSEIFQPRLLERKAGQITRHPQYNPQDPRTVGNNLALVKMDEPVKYSKTIYPIQLPAPGDKFTDYANKLGENVEWSFFPQSNKQLKDVNVKILNAAQCGNFNNNYKQVVTPEIICAINIDNSTKPCGKENGGLLTVIRPKQAYNVTVLVGLTAWEPPNNMNRCPDVALPRIYVRTADKLTWIKANTGDAMYCRY